MLPDKLPNKLGGTTEQVTEQVAEEGEHERPSLLDNRADATHHGDALSYLADDFDDRHSLSVATGYVNLGGLRHLAALAEGRDRGTRLLLGAMPTGIGAPTGLVTYVAERIDALYMARYCRSRYHRTAPSNSAKS